MVLLSGNFHCQVHGCVPAFLLPDANLHLILGQTISARGAFAADSSRNLSRCGDVFGRQLWRAPSSSSVSLSDRPGRVWGVESGPTTSGRRLSCGGLLCPALVVVVIC